MRTGSRIAVVFTFASLSVVAAPSRAHAENTEPFFYSDDAALTGGAVVSTTRDAGAIWYNPAGLGGVKRTQIDLSGSAFGVRIRHASDALVTTLPSNRLSVSLDSTDIFSAPHALGLVRTISDTVAIGFGLYVTARDVRTAESEIETTDPSNGVHYKQRLDIAVDQTRYHMGPALGWEIMPGLRLGAAVFATYGKENGFAQYLLDVEGTTPTGPATGVVISQNRIAFSYFGTQASVGMQWDPSPDASLGLLIRSPELVLSTSTDAANLLTTAVATPGQPGQASFGLTKPSNDYPTGTIIAPIHVVAGAAYHLATRTWLSAEIDVQAPYSNQGLEGSTVVNARVGGRVQLSNRVSVGLGLFSDRAPEPSLGNEFTNERIDWYGASGGLELRTPLALSGRDEADPLILSTTIALKYALGTGTFRAQDLDATSNNTPPPREVDVLYHTILPYIGSAVAF